MRGGGRGFIIIGVMLALAAVVLVVVALAGGNQDETDEPPVAMGSYVITTADVPAHAILAATDVEEVEIALDEVPDGAATNVGSVIGMAYQTPLSAAQVVMTAQLEQPGLSNDVADGMRAIALPIDETSALYGLVGSGDHVDVVFKARLDLVRLLPGSLAEMPVEEVEEIVNQAVGIGEDLSAYPATGEEGTRVFLRDALGDEGQLEPVAKVVLQDVRVLRIVRPGQSFTADGQPAEALVVEEAATGPEAESSGALILEVRPEQAEVVTFMQDERHSYQIAMRGRDDHATVSTTGITFEILAENEDYDLPMPGPVTVEEPEASPVAANGPGPASAEATQEASPGAES
jgi:pilus assembly protein CpaB